MNKRKFKRKELSTPEKIELRSCIIQTALLVAIFFLIFFILKNCQFR